MSSSPSFIAKFESGDSVVITRMTVHTPKDRLNLARGVHLARAAFESRMKKPAPAIVSAHYERDGEILENYDVEQLNAVA
jgi:hypothetical protein